MAKVIDYTKKRMHSLVDGRRVEKCPMCGRPCVSSRTDFSHCEKIGPLVWQSYESYTHTTEDKGLYMTPIDQCSRNVAPEGAKLAELIAARTRLLEKYAAAAQAKLDEFKAAVLAAHGPEVANA